MLDKTKGTGHKKRKGSKVSRGRGVKGKEKINCRPRTVFRKNQGTGRMAKIFFSIIICVDLDAFD